MNLSLSKPICSSLVGVKGFFFIVLDAFFLHQLHHFRVGDFFSHMFPFQLSYKSLL